MRRLIIGALTAVPTLTMAPRWPVGDPQGWFAMHCGGGGEVQNIVVDPATPGRLYVLSDMEGLYRSDDYGRSWTILSRDLPEQQRYALATDPDRPERVYLGTHRGAFISDDAGLSWKPVAETIGHPVGLVAVAPAEPSTICLVRAAPDAADLTGEIGDAWVSRDRGVSFARRDYAGSFRSPGNAYAAAVCPTRASQIAIASDAGLFVSRDRGDTWQRQAPPPGSSGGCTGAAITPDGRFIYAVFRVANGARVYAARFGAISEASWTPVDHLEFDRDLRLLQPGQTGRDWDGEEYTEARGTVYARLAMDPRSCRAEYGMANRHRLLLGKTMKAHGDGLWEGWFDASAGTPTGGGWKRILSTAFQKGWEVDRGWDNYMQVSFAGYSGVRWGADREIYVAIGQGALRLDPRAPGFAKQGGAQPIYTSYVRTVGGHPFFTTRGWQSTYNVDMAAHDNYVLQSQADHGMIESWDGGKSWTKTHKFGSSGFRAWEGPLTNGQAWIVTRTNPPVALIGLGKGYGADDVPCGVFAMKIEKGTPEDRWFLLAGGDRALNGVTDYNGLDSPRDEENWKIVYRHSAMVEDAIKPGRVRVATQQRGIWVCDDALGLIAAGKPAFRQVYRGQEPIEKGSLVAHPLEENRIFFASGRSVMEGRGDAFRPFKTGDGAAGDVCAWAHNGKTYIAAVLRSIQDNSDEVWITDDDGAHWTRAIGRGDVRRLNPPVWFETSLAPPDDRTYTLSMQGICGYRDWIYIPCGAGTNMGVGMYRGTITGSGTNLRVVLEDFRGTYPSGGWHPYPRVNEGKILKILGKTYVAHATRGSGMIVRCIDE